MALQQQEIPISHTYADSGAYSIQVVITDINGCTQTVNASQQVTIVKPFADFNINMLSSSCTMVNLQLTNTSTGSNSYTWDLGDGTMSSLKDVNKYYYYGPNPPYTYDIKLTAYNNGCASTKTISQAVIIPDFKVKFSYTRSQGCLPITINVTDSSLNAVSWKWSWGDGDTTFSQTSQHTFTTLPTDKIKLFAKDVNGCEKNYELDNIQLPLAAFTQSDTIGCNPKMIHFADSSKNAQQWFWKFGNGLTSSNQNPSITYNNIGNFTPSLIITDSFGCKDTIAGKVISISKPQADFIYTKSSGCVPVLVQFQNTSSGASNYLWDFGDGTTSTLLNPNHIYTTGGNYQVTLTVTDAAGCSTTKSLANALHIPGPSASFSLSNNYGCQPLTISLNDSSQNALTHIWSFGDGDTSLAASPVHTFNTAGSYLVTLIVKDVNGCQSAFTHPDTIKVYNKPVAAFSISDSSICAGTSTSFVNLSQSSSSYKWLFGDGSTSQHSNVNHQYQSPGQYNITLVASNGYCSDTVNSINAVTVISFPVADFGGSPLIGCVPLSSNLVNMSTSLQNPVFMWDGGNGLTSTAFNPLFYYQSAGYYSVTLRVTNNGLCSDSITKHNFIAAQNNQPISPSEINYITVLDSNAIRISWQPSSATNLNRYELYRSNDDKNYNLIYTDTNINNSTFNLQLAFIDNNVTTNQNRYYYKLLTINNCNNSFPLDSSKAHATILLTTESDTMANLLSWLPYSGKEVTIYSIYRSIDGLNYDLIAEVAGTESSYFDSTAYCQQEYSYKIEAQLAASIYTSESNNDASVPTSLVNQISTSIIRSTVVDNSSILTEWVEGSPFSELVSYYLIYKASDKDPGNFTLIDSVNSSTKYYLDRDVDVNTNTYQYKIEVENICQQRTGLTDLSGNILLQGKLDDMNNSRLEWTPYNGWKEGVERYEIQKQDENGNWKTIKSVDGKTHHMEEE
jgi:PKD repeat protein